MAAIKVKTAKRVIPMIYAYTTPEIKRHDGWTKIGYTEQDVDKRLNQQTHTADVEYKEEWRGTAIFDDGSGEVFRDTDFHAYLRKNKVEVQEEKDNEWFHITGPESRIKFYEFKENRGVLKSLDVVSPISCERSSRRRWTRPLRTEIAMSRGNSSGMRSRGLERPFPYMISAKGYRP